nr:jasmonic acid-amido synthetase JAR1 [Ipomoea batatas]
MVEKKKMFNPENVIEQFEALTMDAGRVQEETLRRILEDNNETEYLRKWVLASGFEEFRLFCAACFGTTQGKPKLVSFNDELIDNTIQIFKTSDLLRLGTGNLIPCSEARDEILKECCNCLDRSFLDEGYMSSRLEGELYRAASWSSAW